jgi:hypothetical protein
MSSTECPTNAQGIARISGRDLQYERILKEIKKPNRDFARRVLQCLVVATRPLRVEELGEVLAVDFNDAEGIPRLNPDWR